MLLLLLSTSAMTCDEYDAETMWETRPCILTNVEIHSWDNEGEMPQTPTNGRIKKEAYILEIRLFSDADTFPEDCPQNILYLLEDGITELNIYTEETFNEEFPKGANVTSCFQDYPISLTRYQINDITGQQDTIKYMKPVNQIFKALTTIPQPGIHRFSIELITSSGKKAEYKSDDVTLY